MPLLLLAWGLVVAMTQIPFSLGNIEPFDAWIFRIAGWASLAIAIAGLAASMFVLVAYRRFGCPASARLVGRSARSDGTWTLGWSLMLC